MAASTHRDNDSSGSITAPKLVWWLLGMFAMILIAAASTWGKSVSVQLSEIDQNRQTNSQRIETMAGDYKTILYRLDQIERKLDNIHRGSAQ